MDTNIATDAAPIEIRVKYIHPAGNKTGSLGVLRESDGAVETYRSQYGITTEWLYVSDPATGMELKAFRPIEGNTLRYVRDERGIRNGQVCILTQRAVSKRGQMTWRFISIKPV
ncbi:MAG: hypothetical protein ACHRXM_05305 [Isosphaerales bacterium]